MNVLLAIARASIWAPGAIPAHEGELARDVKRWVLPPFDALLILGSALGLSGGMPSLMIVYNEAVSSASAVAVLAFSIGCLLGISFPRWWLLEMLSKCGLVFILATYALMLFGLAFAGSEARGFVAGVTAACAVLPTWRILWLGREHRRRVLAARLVGGS